MIRVIGLGFLALASGCVALDGAVPGERDLFNGRNLDGWYAYLRGRGKNCDPKGVFSVKDGVIHVTGEELGCITTEESFSNYVLSVEYRWLGTTYGFIKEKGRALDSGILFHSRGKDGGYSGTWMPCYEYNLVLGSSGELWTVGTKDIEYAYDVELSDEKVCGKYPIGKPGAPKVRVSTSGLRCSCERWDIARDWTDTRDVKPACNENPEGEWNECRLVCRGDEVECYFNGKLVNRASGLNITSGRIQLQSEGCGIEFRNVRIKSLEGMK